MFQNSYQNGTFFELFDPKLPQQKTKNLYKQQNVAPNNKVFDKQLKTFIYQFNNPNSRISFPREDKKQLYLIQQYLCLQVQFSTGDWNIQLTVSDLTKTKRRIIISPSVHKVQKKPFFVKSVCPHVTYGKWTNFFINLYSFMEAFKGQTYRSLDSIQLTGVFKLKRVYTTQHLIPQLSQQNQVISLLPKNLSFPPQIQVQNICCQFQDIHHDDASQHTQVSTKSSTNIPNSKVSKKQIISKKQIASKKEIKEVKQLKSQKSINLQQKKQVKQEQSKIEKTQIKQQHQTQPLKQEKQEQVSLTLVSKQAKDIKIQDKKQVTFKNQKKFLANTNGLQSLFKNKNRNNLQATCQQISKNAITPLSTGKNLKNRKQIHKAIQGNNKTKQTSVQKLQFINQNKNPRNNSKKKQIEKPNPWRSSLKNKNETGRCQALKIQDERKVESAQATLFKSGNNLIVKLNQTKSKNFQRNSDCSRDDDYFQLSQKFSTVTQGRFFKNELGSRNFQQQQKQTQDQIQQNIQIQTNSHYSKTTQKSPCPQAAPVLQKQNIHQQLFQKPIEQSINDSLDEYNSPRRSPLRKQNLLLENQSYFNMSSRCGFGSKMMEKFNRQIDRPYSPPLGERERDREEEVQNRVIGGNRDKQVELMYDPVLNCYYDHKTHTYYQLKN